MSALLEWLVAMICLNLLAQLDNATGVLHQSLHQLLQANATQLIPMLSLLQLELAMLWWLNLPAQLLHACGQMLNQSPDVLHQPVNHFQTAAEMLPDTGVILHVNGNAQPDQLSHHQYQQHTIALTLIDSLLPMLLLLTTVWTSELNLAAITYKEYVHGKKSMNNQSLNQSRHQLLLDTANGLQ